MTVDSLQSKKIDIRFKRFDTDGDGVLTEADFVGAGQRFLDAYGVTADDPKGKAVLDGYRNYWTNHARGLDANQDGTITREEFHAGAARNLMGADGVEETVVPLTRAVLALTDSDGNGTLDQAEFARLMGVLGVPREDAQDTFAGVDRDGDGAISFDEFLDAAREFYTSTDSAAAGNTLFGR